MGPLKGPIQFTGSIGGIRCYYDKALQRWIISTKGGSTKELIKHNKAFARQRENMNEFKVCSYWASQLQKSFLSLNHLYKGYYFPKIVKLGKAINKLDRMSSRGVRSLESSKFPELLTRIRFNMFYSFDEVFTHPYEVSFLEDKKTVTLKIFGLISNWDIHWPEKYDSFRITLAIAQLSDWKWVKSKKCYEPVIENARMLSVSAYSQWRTHNTVSEDILLEASFAEPALPKPGTTVMVGMGIEFSPTKVAPDTLNTWGNGTMKILECFA